MVHNSLIHLIDSKQEFVKQYTKRLVFVSCWKKKQDRTSMTKLSSLMLSESKRRKKRHMNSAVPQFHIQFVIEDYPNDPTIFEWKTLTFVLFVDKVVFILNHSLIMKLSWANNWTQRLRTKAAFLLQTQTCWYLQLNVILQQSWWRNIKKWNEKKKARNWLSVCIQFIELTWLHSGELIVHIYNLYNHSFV